MSEPISLFTFGVLGVLLLGELLIVLTLVVFSSGLVFFMLWRWIRPQIQDPYIAWWIRLLVGLLALGLTFKGLVLLYELALQTKDYLNALL